MSRFDDDGPGFFGYLLRLLVVLVLVAGVGFVAFAYFGDLGRTPEPRRVPVELQLG